MFYVNNIKNYPHDKDLYLFKRDLLNRIREAASPIKKLYKDKDVDKLICEQTSSVASQSGWGTKDFVPSMIIDIKELTIDSNRKKLEAAIMLYNKLL